MIQSSDSEEAETLELWDYGRAKEKTYEDIEHDGEGEVPDMERDEIPYMRRDADIPKQPLRRSHRTTAGRHSNLHKEPKSTVKVNLTNVIVDSQGWSNGLGSVDCPRETAVSVSLAPIVHVLVLNIFYIFTFLYGLSFISHNFSQMALRKVL